jgi:molybdenum cofactor biosynthesis enzyme MoaA
VPQPGEGSSEASAAPHDRPSVELHEVVERWRYRDGSGEIGVIASVTRPF